MKQIKRFYIRSRIRIINPWRMKKGQRPPYSLIDHSMWPLIDAIADISGRRFDRFDCVANVIPAFIISVRLELESITAIRTKTLWAKWCNGSILRFGYDGHHIYIDR